MIEERCRTTTDPLTKKVAFTACFVHVFRLFSCVLAFVLLPLDFLYRLDSFVASVSPWEIARSVPVMVAFFVLVALAIAILFVFAAWLLRVVCTSSVVAHCLRTANIIACGCAVYLYSRYMKLWLLNNGYRIGVPSVVIALILGVIIYVRTHGRFHAAADRVGQLLTKPLVTTASLGLVVICWQGITASSVSGAVPAVPEVKKRPNVIIVTFDALSARDMSLYGYELPTTPAINRFAGKSFVYDHVISTSNWTRPAITSLLTGKYPDRHKIINLGVFNNSNERPQESLPALLKGAGYFSAALVSGWEYAHPYATGMDRYFDYLPVGYLEWAQLPLDNVPVKLLWKVAAPFAYRKNYLAITWLYDLLAEFGPGLKVFSGQKEKTYLPAELPFANAESLIRNRQAEGTDRPFFTWVHISPPHSPYLPDEASKGAFLPQQDVDDLRFEIDRINTRYVADLQPAVDRQRLRYDENILYADRAFGRFVEFLDKSGRLGDSIVIVSADHGEMFSHGFFGHNYSVVYEPAVHIPLLIHLPGQTSCRREEGTVSQTDIAPTVLHLCGLDVPSWVEGQDLRPGGNSDVLSRPVYTMNLDGNPVSGPYRKGVIAVFADSYKYIHDIGKKTGELYNLADDPAEKVDLSTALPDMTREMQLNVAKRLALHGSILSN